MRRPAKKRPLFTQAKRIARGSYRPHVSQTTSEHIRVRAKSISSIRLEPLANARQKVIQKSTKLKVEIK